MDGSIAGRNAAFAIFSSLIAAVLLVSGCASRPGIVGRWTNAGQSIDTTIYEFKADDTMAITTTGRSVTFVMNGTYTANDGKLVMKPTSLTLNGSVRRLDQNKASAFADYKVDGDQLTVTRSGKQLVLKRLT